MKQGEKTKIVGALIGAADVLMDADKARANKILRRAIALAKNPMAKEWLRDGKASGTWIRTAADLLERSAAKAAELGLSEDDVDDEVAAMMAWMALTAILRDAKKGSGLLTSARTARYSRDELEDMQSYLIELENDLQALSEDLYEMLGNEYPDASNAGDFDQGVKEGTSAYLERMFKEHPTETKVFQARHKKLLAEIDKIQDLVGSYEGSGLEDEDAYDRWKEGG